MSTTEYTANDKCWYCGGQLSWGADFAYDEVYGRCDNCKKDSCDGIATNLTCTNCGAEVEYSRRCPEYEEE